MSEQVEQTIPMPVKQYADCIMAIQKLEDIRRVANQDYSCEEEAGALISSIRAITSNG